jgi:hypothetical protein
MVNPNANSAALAGGGSVAVPNELAAPGVRVTAADLYPMRMQTLNSIEEGGTIGGLQFPSDRGKYFMTLGLHDYSRSPSDLMGVFVNMAKLNITNTITLPLPQQMTDSHSVNYAEEALGQGLAATTEAGSGLMNAMAGNMSNIGQALGGLLGAGTSTFLQGIKDFTGINAPGLTQALAGVAPNQFLTILLKGPQYKKHSFTWKLSPRNEGESESIRAIIALLNNSMAPGMSAGTGNAFFSFPKIVTLSFMPNSNVLYRFKPAVIENMTVNYAPSGAPAFYRRTEAPDTIEMKLDFLEVEYWLTGDFGASSALDTSGLSALRAQQGGREGRGV